MMLLSLLLLAAPTSHPTSQPTSQPSAPRADERVIEDAKLHFHFAVPRLWKAVPQTADAVIYVFSLPAVGESRRVAPSFIVTARDAAGEEFAKEVEARRAAMQAHNPGSAFDEDIAATVAGHDGWTFAYSTTIKQTVTEMPSKKQHEEQVVLKVRDQLVAINGKEIEFVLTSDDKGLVIRRKLVDRAISTLVVE